MTEVVAVTLYGILIAIIEENEALIYILMLGNCLAIVGTINAMRLSGAIMNMRYSIISFVSRHEDKIDNNMSLSRNALRRFRRRAFIFLN